MLVGGNVPYSYLTAGVYARAANDYNGAPVYTKGDRDGRTWSLYRRAYDRWVLDFNAVDEKWAGTVAYSRVDRDDTKRPHEVSWNKCSNRDCPSPTFVATTANNGQGSVSASPVPSAGYQVLESESPAASELMPREKDEGESDGEADGEAKDGETKEEEKEPPAPEEPLGEADEPEKEPANVNGLVVGLAAGGGALVLIVLLGVACYCTRKSKGGAKGGATAAAVPATVVIPSEADIEAACEERATSFDKNKDKHANQV